MFQVDWNVPFDFWQSLTEPVETVTDWQDRQQSRLLTSLMLAAALCSLGLSPIPLLFRHYSPIRDSQFWLGIAFGLLTLVFYYVSRRGYYRTVSLMVSLLASVAILVGAFLLGGTYGFHTLYYLTVVIIFAGMFLSATYTISLTLIQNLVIILYGVHNPAVGVENAITGPLIFNLTTMTVTLLIVAHRNRLNREQQQRIAESEDRYRAISEIASDYAFSIRVRPDGSFAPEWVSESFSELTGYVLDELGGEQCFYPVDRDAVHEDLQRAAQGETRQNVYRMACKNGVERWIRLYRRPVWDDAHRRVESIINVVQDITGQREAETQRLEIALAKERSELMHQIFREVAHDFRTSLAVISTTRYMVQMLIDQSQTQQVPELLNQIEEQVRRLTQQIENLRIVSLLNNPVTEACDPNAIASMEIADQQQQIEAKRLQFSFTPDPDAPQVRAHSNELRRAIRHLLENAISYTESGGSVTMCVEHSDSQVMVHISDTGMGIDPAEEANIFDFFYRTEIARKVDERGVGLGLAIAKIVAEAYGGEIVCHSQPGQGSTFTLVMPAYDQAKKEPAV